MAKRKGLGGNSIGTGSVDPAGDRTGSTTKWTDSIQTQVADFDRIRPLLAKFVPLGSVKVDPNNPRRLAIEPDDVKRIREDFPFRWEVLDQEEAADSIETYLSEIKSKCGLEGDALKHMLSVIEFAFALKNESRLTNPISTWQDGGCLRIAAGERRYLAHAFMGAPAIKTTIFESAPGEHELRLIQWQENMDREDLPLSDKVMNVKSIMDGWSKEKGDPLSVRKLASVIGRSKTQAQRYSAVINSKSSLLHEAIESGKVSDLTKAAQLAAMTEKEISEALDERPATSSGPAAVKLSSSASPNAARYIINTITDSIASEELRGQLAPIDMDTDKGIKKAFKLIVQQLEASGV